MLNENSNRWRSLRMQNYCDIDELLVGGGEGEWLGVVTECGKKISQISF